MATDFLFSGNDILSFTLSLKPLLQLEGDQYWKKSISASENRFLSDSDTNGVVFWCSEIVFSNESFILASENGFLVTYKSCVFIQSFLLLVDTILHHSRRGNIFFLTNPSFQYAESEFLSSGNTSLLFTAFCCFWKPLLALKSVSTSRNEGFCLKIRLH